MPYRIDISSPPADAFEQLVQLGALDIETTPQGIAAIIPDGVTLDDAKCALGVESVAISPAVSRDSGSVWQLSPRAIRIGSVSIVPEAMALPGALRLIESTIFGTGHHPTTGMGTSRLSHQSDVSHEYFADLCQHNCAGCSRSR